MRVFCKVLISAKFELLRCQSIEKIPRLLKTNPTRWHLASISKLLSIWPSRGSIWRRSCHVGDPMFGELALTKLFSTFIFCWYWRIYSQKCSPDGFKWKLSLIMIISYKKKSIIRKVHVIKISGQVKIFSRLAATHFAVIGKYVFNSSWN